MTAGPGSADSGLFENQAELIDGQGIAAPEPDTPFLEHGGAFIRIRFVPEKNGGFEPAAFPVPCPWTGQVLAVIPQIQKGRPYPVSEPGIMPPLAQQFEHVAADVPVDLHGGPRRTAGLHRLGPVTAEPVRLEQFTVVEDVALADHGEF
jgi:hypothetical protein